MANRDGSFYELDEQGRKTPLTVRGYRRDDGSYVPIGKTYELEETTTGGGGTTPSTGDTYTGPPSGGTGRTSIMFGVSPGGGTTGFAQAEQKLGRLRLVRRYSNYTIPGTGSALRRDHYWHEERVRILLDGDGVRTGAQVAADLVDALPAGSFVTAGHENDNDTNLPAALRVLVTACLNRTDGGVRVAPIGRGFELRNTAQGSTEDIRVTAMRDRIMPTAVENANNTYFQMHRTHSATNKPVGCIAVDLYNGKNADNGTTTTQATNGQKLAPWEVYGPCVKLGISADLPWLVGETAYMVSLNERLLADGTANPNYKLGNKTDQEMANYWRECMAFWLNPVSYYADHRYPGGRPPDTMCYWYSFNGDVNPAAPNNFYLTDFPKTAAVWRDLIQNRSRL